MTTGRIALYSAAQIVSIGAEARQHSWVRGSSLSLSIYDNYFRWVVSSKFVLRHIISIANGFLIRGTQWLAPNIWKAASRSEFSSLLPMALLEDRIRTADRRYNPGNFAKSGSCVDERSKEDPPCTSVFASSVSLRSIQGGTKRI